MSTSMPRRSSVALMRSAAALAKALSSGWATTRSARNEGLFPFSLACRHEHKGGYYSGDILKPTSIRYGLLHVDLVREIPEAMKSRSIPIASSSKLLEAKPTKVAA